MKISLKRKKINEEKYSLYIQYSQPKDTSEGKRIYDRKSEYLKKYIWINPDTVEKENHNIEVLAFSNDLLKGIIKKHDRGILDDLIGERDPKEKLFVDMWERQKNQKIVKLGDKLNFLKEEISVVIEELLKVANSNIAEINIIEEVKKFKVKKPLPSEEDDDSFPVSKMNLFEKEEDYIFTKASIKEKNKVVYNEYIERLSGKLKYLNLTYNGNINNLIISE